MTGFTGRDIGNWDVSKVSDFSYAFYDNLVMNADLNNWNTSSATTLRGLFLFASSFSCCVDKWDVSKVRWSSLTHHRLMSHDSCFLLGPSFNGITGCRYQCYLCTHKAGRPKLEFLVRISCGARVHKCTHPHGVCYYRDVSRVTDMSQTFTGADFNGIVADWDTSNVVNMYSMVGDCLPDTSLKCSTIRPFSSKEHASKGIFLHGMSRK